MNNPAESNPDSVPGASGTGAPDHPFDPFDPFDPSDSGEIFHTAFEYAPIGIALVDPSGRWLTANDSLCRIVGYTKAELLDRTFQDITHPDDLETDLIFFRETLEGKRDGYQLEKRYIHKDGQAIWIQLSTTLVRNPDRTPRLFISHIEDITARKYMAERLHLATDAAGIGVYDFEVATQSARWDERMFAIYGIAPTSDGGVSSETWQSLIAPEDLPATIQSIQEAARGGSDVFDISFRILNSLSGVRYLRANGRIVHDCAGRAVRFVGVNWDITDQELAKQQLRAAKDAAEEANRAKSAFLAMMSHEIRTPLNGVIGFTHLLADTPLSHEQREFLTSIKTGGETLLTIINDILDYSKIEAGKANLERIPFSLSKCVRASMDMLSIKAAEKGLRLVSGIDRTVPQTVIGDVTRLRQVLTNLLSNAIKFTAKGKVTVGVKSEAMENGESAIHFTVTDTGIGMPEQKMEHLFQPFNQLDASTTRRFGGTGLGLAISHRLVELMGGRIWMESRIGKGTSAHVLLPLPSDGATPIGGGEDTVRLQKQSTAAITGLPGLDSESAALRILVAEDNATNQRLILQLLKRMGAVNVQLAADGSEAIELAAASPLDVILMDCQMPRMDGYEATRRLRLLEEADPSRPRLQIVALTAAALDGDRQKALSAGMDDYLTKPLRPESLSFALARAARRKADA